MPFTVIPVQQQQPLQAEAELRNCLENDICFIASLYTLILLSTQIIIFNIKALNNFFDYLFFFMSFNYRLYSRDSLDLKKFCSTIILVHTNFGLKEYLKNIKCDHDILV